MYPREGNGRPNRSPDRKGLMHDYVCYFCGDASHFVKDCPHKSAESSKQVQIKEKPENFEIKNERR